MGDHSFRQQIAEDIAYYQTRHPHIPNIKKDEWAFNYWVLDKLFSEDEDAIEGEIVDYSDHGIDCYVWHEDSKDLYLIQNKYYSEGTQLGKSYFNGAVQDAYGQLLLGSYTRSAELQKVFSKYHDDPSFYVYHYFYVTNNDVSPSLESAVKDFNERFSDSRRFAKVFYLDDIQEAFYGKPIQEKRHFTATINTVNKGTVLNVDSINYGLGFDIDAKYIMLPVTSLFEMLPNDKECPICHSRIANKSAIDTSYFTAIQGEYDKLKAKIADVCEVVAKKNQTIGSLIQKIQKTQAAIGVTYEKIKMFATQMAGIKETLRQYQKNIEKKTESNYLASELSRLLKKLDKLNKERTQKPAIEPYIRQTDIKEDFCREMKEKLVAWNLLRENDTVVFDENGFDFILGAKDRLSCGKGSRGVTCSAILMTLVEYCHKKDIPFSNFLVIDSPITAHYDDEDMEADETTQARFFKYCNDTTFDYQLILIDNKAPDEEMRGQMSNIHYIQFTKENGFYQGKE